MKILIIDDDLHIGNFLEEILQREGYEVIRAYSGTESLLVLEKETPDLILLDLRLDPISRETTVGGKPVKLTRTEYAILKLLLTNPHQVVVKSVILDRISQDTPDCTENSLKQHVSNLRKKLREAGGEDLIESVWGIGFKLREP